MNDFLYIFKPSRYSIFKRKQKQNLLHLIDIYVLCVCSSAFIEHTWNYLTRPIKLQLNKSKKCQTGATRRGDQKKFKPYLIVEFIYKIISQY
jgi:hypothetical protein